MHPHSLEERNDIVGRTWYHELPIVEPETNPQVVHQNREPDHHCGDAPRTAKFIPAERISWVRLLEIGNATLGVGREVCRSCGLPRWWSRPLEDCLQPLFVGALRHLSSRCLKTAPFSFFRLELASEETRWWARRPWLA